MQRVRIVLAASLFAISSAASLAMETNLDGGRSINWNDPKFEIKRWWFGESSGNVSKVPDESEWKIDPRWGNSDAVFVWVTVEVTQETPFFDLTDVWTHDRETDLILLEDAMDDLRQRKRLQMKAHLVDRDVHEVNGNDLYEGSDDLLGFEVFDLKPRPIKAVREPTTLTFHGEVVLPYRCNVSDCSVRGQVGSSGEGAGGEDPAELYVDLLLLVASHGTDFSVGPKWGSRGGSTKPARKFCLPRQWSWPHAKWDSCDYVQKACKLFPDYGHVWRQRVRYAASKPEELLGSALAVSEDHMVVGAPGGKHGRVELRGLGDSGTSFYERSRTGLGTAVSVDQWSLAASTHNRTVHAYRWDPHLTWMEDLLEESDPDPARRFGHDVAVEHECIIVSAPSEPGAGADDALYVFRWFSREFIEVQQILASDLTLEFGSEPVFGQSIAMDGGRLFVGAPGAECVLIFEQDAGMLTWSHVETVRAESGFSGRFGEAVSTNFDGTMLAVGAPGEQGERGAAYLFQLADGHFQQRARMVDEGARAGDQLGAAVSLSLLGDRVAIGAPAIGTTHGLGRVLLTGAPDWEGGSQVIESPAPHSLYGASLAWSGSCIYVGAPWAGIGGEVYVIEPVPDFELTANARRLAPNDRLELTAAGGLPGSQVIVKAVGINGALSNVTVASGLIGNSESWSLEGPTPPFLEGLEIEFQAFGTNLFGDLASSWKVPLEFRSHPTSAPEARKDPIVTFNLMYLRNGSRLVARFEHPEIDWSRTKHSFVMEDGTERGDTWFQKRLRDRFFVRFEEDGAVRVEYFTEGQHGRLGVRQVRVALETWDGESLGEYKYALY